MTTTKIEEVGTGTEQALSAGQSDLLETLATHRFFLRFTARDLTDEQAASRPTASALCIGGLIKHVAETESEWARFIVEGTSAMPNEAEVDYEARERGWSLQPGETLAGVLAHYAEVAARTDAVIRALPNLDVSHPLPVAPWFKPGASWSARRTLLHIIAETAQHAGHADITRETIDGSKTMG